MTDRMVLTTPRTAAEDQLINPYPFSNVSNCALVRGYSCVKIKGVDAPGYRFALRFEFQGKSIECSYVNQLYEGLEAVAAGLVKACNANHELCRPLPTPFLQEKDWPSFPVIVDALVGDSFHIGWDRTCEPIRISSIGNGPIDLGPLETSYDTVFSSWQRFVPEPIPDGSAIWFHGVYINNRRIFGIQYNPGGTNIQTEGPLYLNGKRILTE